MEFPEGWGGLIKFLEWDSYDATEKFHFHNKTITPPVPFYLQSRLGLFHIPHITLENTHNLESKINLRPNDKFS